MRRLWYLTIVFFATSTPALAGNPDGPPGLLTVSSSYSGVVAWDDLDLVNGQPSGFQTLDFQLHRFALGIRLPVVSYFSLDAEYSRLDTDQFSQSDGDTFDYESTDHRLLFGARFHLPLTSSALAELRD